ncbi:transporter [Flavobacterium sediminis]|uniref:Transporter n=1 Tax=Flavobacterium sediminis TaxID=2201181 RepID=A0A2U8QWM4_9FLAO|nr:TolC family protein [Flavobacterium sediminis]AWM14607.1 transporter [Flavobacterium sediminis]
MKKQIFKLHVVGLLVLFSIQTKAQDLNTILDEALRNNPEVQEIESQYKITKEKENEVNVLPNTELGIGVFAITPETRTGAQTFKVSVRQMIPWFGTITARENYAVSLSEAKYQDLVIVKRKLISTVSQSYYKLYEIKEKIRVLEENKTLLKTYEKLALTSVEVGKASLVDVLKLQIRQNELAQLQSVLSEQFKAEQTVLNKLLNRDSEIAVDLITDLEIPDEKEQVSFESLEIHPELLKYDKLFHSVEKSELLNQKEKRPMIGFGLDYINVEKRPDMDFRDNGKDALMPMVSLSIPIFNKKYKSVSKQNELKQEEIKAQKQNKLNFLEASLQKAISNRNASRISHDTQVKNLEQAKSAEQILIKSYETGTIDFNDVLDIQEFELKFQINKITSVVDYYIQSTIINYLIK